MTKYDGYYENFIKRWVIGDIPEDNIVLILKYYFRDLYLKILNLIQ